MSDITFTPVNEPEHIAELANLADRIWHEYFPTFLDQETIDYLLDKMLSTGALISQIADEDYEYYFIDRGEDEHIGFVGIAPRDGHLFLSKLYLLKSERGRGYSRIAFDFIKSRAREFGFEHIQLTCNRYNTESLDIYDHMGFRKIGRQDTDMGEGIQMNDFVLDWEFDH